MIRKLKLFNLTRQSDREERFRRLFVELYPKLVRHAVVLVGSRDEAEDIVGEAFRRAWELSDPTDESLGGWLYTTVRNGCLNRLKHLSVERQHLERIVEATRSDAAEDYREHEALLRKAESVARALPEPTRTILRLCYWEKLTHRQAAERLGISPDTVKKHIGKALRMLREEMKKENE